MSRAVYAFKPYNVGRWIIWSFFALLLVVAPLPTLAAIAYFAIVVFGVVTGWVVRRREAMA